MPATPSRSAAWAGVPAPKSRPKSEFLNDLNGEIVNLFRMLREHPKELARQFDPELCI